MSFIKLPTTLSDFSTLFQGHSDLKSVLKYCQNPSKLPPYQAKAWKYSGGALLKGRPLDSVMIFMAGASGAGKSSTINVLFEDPDLCATSASTSETKDPVIVQKRLCVKDETPAVVGNLSFIDVPGTFDTDSKNEVVNLASIRKFKESRIELASRSQLSKQIPSAYCSISPTVYPNLILFVVKATDNRISGPDSFFRKSLQVFRDTANLVDQKNPNIIIVLTHVASIARKKEKFVTLLAQKVATIQEMTYQELKIKDVPVVPVENDGEGQDLDEEKGFYKLPNGERSHFNLFQAMVKQLDRTGDVMGKLFVAHYFDPDCPEKKAKAEIIQSKEELTDDDLARAGLNLQNLKISVSDEHNCLKLHFQSLGCGYCPVTEEIKPVNLLQTGGDAGNPDQEVAFVKIQNTNFVIPKCVVPFVSQSSSFHRLSFYEKEEYQSHMKASYGIEAGFKLVVSASSQGRWVNNESGSSSTSLVSLAQEITVASFKLDNPRVHVKYPMFWKELGDLPDKYNDDTASTFQSFFSKWGSHLVYEQAIGGAITLNCTVEKVAMTRDKLQEVEARVSGIFKAFSAAAEGSHSTQVAALHSVGVSNEHLQIDGGVPPTLVTLETMNSAQMQAWSKTVPEKPVSLNRSIKLYPYYNLVDCGPRCEALREATADYLKDTLSVQIASRAEEAKKKKKEAAEAPAAGGGCFPKGTMIPLWNGTRESIENLQNTRDNNTQIRTIEFLTTKGSLQLGNGKRAKFCTYLDYMGSDYQMEYLVLHFSNGRRLIVSDSHLIFQYLPVTDSVVGKQAKYFNVGERAIYKGNGAEEKGVETPEIVCISREIHSGAYSPLTTSGTFIADGFLVSSYANTDSFALAQAALFPLKIWSRMAKEKRQGGTTCAKEGIHPFAKLLMTLRKSGSAWIPKQ